MKNIIYIGVDDTDILGEPPGTGRVARELARYLEELGFGQSLGVSRHQLLVDPRIPYTSHNSSLCIAMEIYPEWPEFVTPCVEYIEKHAKLGSDPGLCIMPRNSFNKELIDFGWSATKIVLANQEAIDLANKNDVVLKQLGGTGGGIIGALAGAALRCDGNNGRFVELKGIREITGIVSVADLKTRTDIVEILDADGHALSDTERIESYDWVRPSLFRGDVVLRVQPLTTNDGSRLWEPVENRKDSPKKIKVART